MNDDLFEYLVATDQVDEFFGLKEEQDEIDLDEENYDDYDEESKFSYYKIK